ncbi:MAG: DMT family transporter [Pseudomonadota bacterium]
MGSTWMLVAGLCFALMSAVVKTLGHAFSGPELVFYRSLFALLAIGVTLFGQGGAAGVRNLLGEHIGLNLRRGVVGFIALATFFHALVELPMAVAVTLNYASPLWLALLMPWWLGEKPGGAQYGAVALGFVGVGLLLRPWEVDGGTLGAGLIGLFSGIMAAFAYIHVRQLGRLGEPEWRTVFWFAAVALVGGAAATSVTGWHAPTLADLPALLAMGLLATLGQLAMTRAYRKGSTVVVASFAYSTVVFSGILEAAIWNEAMPGLSWAGMAVTVAAGVWAVKLNARSST